jgi:hypothetical protein
MTVIDSGTVTVDLATDLPEIPPRDTPPAILTVYDEQASYRGHRATLTTEEQGSIARVIVGAIRRQTIDSLADLKDMLPKRIRRRMATAPAASAEPKKRGRPRKVRPEDVSF